MGIRAATWALTTMLVAGGTALAEEATSGLFSGRGVITAVQPGTGALTIKHGDIKDFMPAMEMMYKVRNAAVSKDLYPGDVIDFTIDATFNRFTLHFSHMALKRSARAGARRIDAGHSRTAFRPRCR